MPRFLNKVYGDGSGLGVLPAGTAVARPLDTRFGEVFNARDRGAVGDGTTDDAPAIQAALDAAKALGGGEVLLPSGVYQIGTQANPLALYLADNVTLKGMGGTTILRRAPGVATNPGQPLVTNEVLRVGSGVTSNTGIRIRDLVLDGTQATGGTGRWQDYSNSFELGLWLRSCSDCMISRLQIINHRRDGLVLEWCKDIAVSDVICRGNLKCGIYLAGSDHIAIADCSAHDNSFINWEISTCWFCSLVGCHGHGSSSASLVVGRDTQYLTVAGGHYGGISGIMEAPGGTSPFAADHPGRTGAYDGTTPYGMSNSIISGVTIHTTGGLDGIMLTGGDHNLVMGNRLDHVSGRGIILWGSPNNTILANKITDVGEAGTPDAQDGLVLTAQTPYTNCDNNLIELNEISAPSGATMVRGINVAPNINGTRLRRNAVADATVADVLFDATSPISQDDDPVLARLHSGAPLTGALVVSTPLVRTPTPTAVMAWITVTGYFYAGSAPFSIAVGLFLYVDGGVYNPGYVNIGQNRLRVRTATDPAGKLALVLGDTTTAHSYPQLQVEAQVGWAVNYTAGVGWALSVLSDLSGYTIDAVDVPDVQRRDVPAGGTTGQVASKASNADYDLVWATTGTVTSVGLTVPTWLSASGPVTTAGTIDVTATAGQAANQVLATPDGAPGAIGPRALVAADIPDLSGIYSPKAGNTFLATVGTIVTGTWQGTPIDVAHGGTGQTTAAAAFDALSPNTTLGDLTYRGSTSNARLAGNTTSTRKFLRQTGTGTASAAPAWDTLVASDVPSIAESQVTGLAADLAAKLAAASNLSDLASASTARTNLGLGTAATHPATDFQAAGSYLVTSNNLSDLGSAATARTNLGLGTAATHPATDFLAPTGDGSGLTGLNASALASGTVGAARLPALGASGTGHAAGIAPDPGSSAGSTRYLREDATWAVPAGGGGGGSPGGSSGQVQYNSAGAFAGASNVTVGSNGDLQLAQQTTPASLADGELYYGTQKTLSGSLNGIKQHFVGCIYTQTAEASAVTGTTEGTLVGTGVGTTTLPANFLITGKTVRIRARGTYTPGGVNVGVRWRVKLGGTTIGDTGAPSTIPNQGTSSAQPWILDCEFTTRAAGASGAVRALGTVATQVSGFGGQLQTYGLTSTANATIDTTASNAIDITFTWGGTNSGQVATASLIIIEVLN